MKSSPLLSFIESHASALTVLGVFSALAIYIPTLFSEVITNIIRFVLIITVFLIFLDLLFLAIQSSSKEKDIDFGFIGFLVSLMFLVFFLGAYVIKEAVIIADQYIQQEGMLLGIPYILLFVTFGYGAVMQKLWKVYPKIKVNIVSISFCGILIIFLIIFYKALPPSYPFFTSAAVIFTLILIAEGIGIPLLAILSNLKQQSKK